SWCPRRRTYRPSTSGCALAKGTQPSRQAQRPRTRADRKAAAASAKDATPGRRTLLPSPLSTAVRAGATWRPALGALRCWDRNHDLVTDADACSDCLNPGATHRHSERRRQARSGMATANWTFQSEEAAYPQCHAGTNTAGMRSRTGRYGCRHHTRPTAVSGVNIRLMVSCLKSGCIYLERKVPWGSHPAQDVHARRPVAALTAVVPAGH